MKTRSSCTTQNDTKQRESFFVLLPLNCSQMSWCSVYRLVVAHTISEVLHNSLFFCYITLEGRVCVCVCVCVCIYIALVLVDLHGVLHLRQCFHVGVAGLPLLTIKLLLVELLQRRRERREETRRNERIRTKTSEKMEADELVEEERIRAGWGRKYLMTACCWITTDSTLDRSTNNKTSSRTNKQTLNWVTFKTNCCLLCLASVWNTGFQKQIDWEQNFSWIYKKLMRIQLIDLQVKLRCRRVLKSSQSFRRSV